MTSYLIIRINVSFKIKKIRSDRKTVNKVKKDSGKKITWLHFHSKTKT